MQALHGHPTPDISITKTTIKESWFSTIKAWKTIISFTVRHWQCISGPSHAWKQCYINKKHISWRMSRLKTKILELVPMVIIQRSTQRTPWWRNQPGPYTSKQWSYVVCDTHTEPWFRFILSTPTISIKPPVELFLRDKLIILSGDLIFHILIL